MAEKPFVLGEPDSSFHLSDDERARVARCFDPDALERLLSMYPPEGRADLLRRFQILPQGSEPRVQRVIRLGHPSLQAALEEVWAPYWASHTDEEMETEVDYLPGRDAARRLRRTNAHPDGKPDGRLKST